ncbi:sigma-54-dependent transcriptional regulator [Candidatus Margulisiibacteriota bacterium]
MTTKPDILIIDDEEDMLSMYRAVFKKEYNIDTAADGKEGIKKVKDGNYQAIILDIIMPGISGIEVLKKIKAFDPTIEVIMATASKEIRLAVESLKAGAYDYIIKPFEKDALLSTVAKAIERRSLKEENMNLKQVLIEQQSCGDLIGKNTRIQNIFKVIDMISQNDSTVLITGESGTGKEIVASTIHKKSKRRNKPFIAINCAAIPENLLESELFGYERGAFTGALERHSGKFELASGGTIFLDEIGEMPPAMQAKLLRVVEEGSITKVGGEKQVPINVRIVAATNINIKKAVNEKKFRADLYYRLNVIPIEMPPLRERMEDLALFINYFLDKYNKELNKDVRGFAKETLPALKKYNWPGNVRELENLIERLVSLSNTKTIELDDIPSDLMLRQDEILASTEGLTLNESLDQFEKNFIKKALNRNKWNQTRTAEELKIHRTTLISKMENLGLKETKFQEVD